MAEITALWQEAEAHLREFERLARRTVEEAWLAGDAASDQRAADAWRMDTGVERAGHSSRIGPTVHPGIFLAVVIESSSSPPGLRLLELLPVNVQLPDCRAQGPSFQVPAAPVGQHGVFFALLD